MPYGSGYNAQVIAPPEALLAGVLVAGLILEFCVANRLRPGGIYFAGRLCSDLSRTQPRDVRGKGDDPDQIYTVLRKAGNRPRDVRCLCLEP